MWTLSSRVRLAITALSFASNALDGLAHAGKAVSLPLVATFTGGEWTFDRWALADLFAHHDERVIGCPTYATFLGHQIHNEGFCNQDGKVSVASWKTLS